MIWPKDRWLFGLAVLDLLLAGAMFSDRNSRFGGSLHRYLWIVWLLNAVVFFYRAYRPVKAATSSRVCQIRNRLVKARSIAFPESMEQAIVPPC